MDILRYISMLPPSEIKRAAKDAERLAADLFRQAGRKHRAQLTNARVKRHRARQLTVTKTMVQYLAAGMSPDQAVRAMQKMTALEPDQLQAFVPQALRIFKRKTVQVRHRSMVLLARKGLTDKTIAKRFINPRTGKNYHPKAVNRIVNKNWKLAETHDKNGDSIKTPLAAAE